MSNVSCQPASQPTTWSPAAEPLSLVCSVVDYQYWQPLYCRSHHIMKHLTINRLIKQLPPAQTIIYGSAQLKSTSSGANQHFPHCFTKRFWYHIIKKRSSEWDTTYPCFYQAIAESILTSFTRVHNNNSRTNCFKKHFNFKLIPVVFNISL